MKPRRVASSARAVFVAAVCGGLCAASTPESRRFGQRLWDAALPLANRSLRGRFISQLADGTLPKGVFARYMRQDRLYLTKYARAFAVLGARAGHGDEFAWLLGRARASLREHGFGSTEGLDEEVFARSAEPVTIAYTSFVLQAAWGEEPLLAYASLVPCQRLYDWLFSALQAKRHISADNPYRGFIEQYADASNRRTTRELEAFLERHASGMSEDTTAAAQAHYDAAMGYEAEFFDQAFAPRNGRDEEAADASGLMGGRRPALGASKGGPGQEAAPTVVAVSAEALTKLLAPASAGAFVLAAAAVAAAASAAAALGSAALGAAAPGGAALARRSARGAAAWGAVRRWREGGPAARSAREALLAC